MFIFDKAEGANISTHQFEISGSTYAPEGEVLVSNLVFILVIIVLLKGGFPLCKILWAF